MLFLGFFIEIFGLIERVRKYPFNSIMCGHVHEIFIHYRDIAAGCLHLRLVSHKALCDDWVNSYQPIRLDYGPFSEGLLVLPQKPLLIQDSS